MNRVFKVSEDREILASEWGDNDNPLVIMLHGGGQTRHSWKGVAAKIANLGFHVIAHDLRGHGESFWDHDGDYTCLLYTSPSPRDSCASRMPSSA